MKVVGVLQAFFRAPPTGSKIVAAINVKVPPDRQSTLTCIAW
jgi:hypothetical protein